MRTPFLLSWLLCATLAFGQIPNGSTAPDFTLTDFFGTTHNLYSYLNDGKTVFLEVFAAHCPSCWNYHQTNRLKNIYNMYGPPGTDELMVLALEHDQWNDTNAFIGNGPPWVTQGNWLTGTPYPIFDVEDPDRGVFSDYNITGYPIIFKICPDKIVERVFTNETESQLYQKVQDCQSTVSINELTAGGNMYVIQESKTLVIEGFQGIQSIRVLNVQGQLVKHIDQPAYARIDLSDLRSGIYLFQVRSAATLITKKLSVR